ncbi:hypothetical protein [Streptomyces synnematoformans]|uniref:DNA-binding protein n=1 Tax=Streptomyces synnematoformans TaxID=415721 RepID=A0ABP5IX06_9ACTN
MTHLYGRDGRELVDTAQAAYLMGMKPSSFRGWAKRHGVHAKVYRPNFNGGQSLAYWDLADLADARVQPAGAARAGT